MTVHGGAARGELDCWSFAARSGQLATIVVKSIEHNAVFQLYQPGWKLGSDNGEVVIDGKPYKGAAEGDDAVHWSGRLEVSGNNLLVVGSTRGGTSYELTVTVRP